MVYEYNTKGTCSRKIIIEEENGIIKDVRFVGGCSGNTQGVSTLVRGMSVDDTIKKLSGIDCAGRGTSCPDQLARALLEMKNKK